MSNVAYQKPSFDDQSIYKKATPVAPSESRGAARKADGAFRTISEVADELDVPQHVLRFWETKFTQVKPLKRGGGRRYYRPEDVSLLKHIHNLLYTEGYTIKGVQKLLKGQGKNQIAAKVDALEDAVESVAAPKAETPVQPQPPQTAKIYNLSEHQRGALEDMLTELKALRAMFPEQA
jgi:DNA-binding transcriptional MerR regulator